MKALPRKKTGTDGEPSAARDSRCRALGDAYSPLYGVVESGAARLMRMRTSLELLNEKAAGVLGAVTATKSAR